MKRLLWINWLLAELFVIEKHPISQSKYCIILAPQMRCSSEMAMGGFYFYKSAFDGRLCGTGVHKNAGFTVSGKLPIFEYTAGSDPAYCPQQQSESTAQYRKNGK